MYSRILLASILSIFAQCNGAVLNVIDITGLPVPVRVSVQVCSGLFNRNSSVHGDVYIIEDQKDKVWLNDLYHGEINTMDDQVFIKKCFNSKLVGGYLNYNYLEQRLILPQLITIAGVMNIIPIDITIFDSKLIENITLKFDAPTILQNATLYSSSLYIYNNYFNSTKGISKMDPGLDLHNHPLNPPLIGTINTALIDFIVKEKLFNFFLNYGCIAGTKEHKLMEDIVKNNNWEKPINVYGYDDTFQLGGNLFEAETNCVKEHNMGQIATTGVTNLAYFSNKKRITVPLKQNPDPDITYSPRNKYIAFVVGDGDNIGMVKDDRRDWMIERVSQCNQSKTSTKCFPLLWTLSPKLLKIAPDIMKWYYNMSYLTGADYFVLPPSGDLYSYPAQMSGEIQDNFVKNTEDDCVLMSTNIVVEWEWFGTWDKAFKSYYPKYTKNNIVKGFLTVNVPFIFPIFAFKNDEHYKMISDIAIFKEREWRGTGNSTVPFSKKMYLTVDEMAKEINDYPNNTISYIYLTSDGGGNLQMFNDLVKKLDNNVYPVNHNLLTKFANLAKQVNPTN